MTANYSFFGWQEEGDEAYLETYHGGTDNDDHNGNISSGGDDDDDDDVDDSSIRTFYSETNFSYDASKFCVMGPTEPYAPMNDAVESEETSFWQI